MPDTARDEHGTLKPEDLRFTPPTLGDGDARRFLTTNWGFDGELKRLAGERDQNFRVTRDDGRQFVLKVSSPIEDPLLVDFQVQALLHIDRSDPGVPVPHHVMSVAGNPVETLTAGGESHAVRLLTYIEGVPWSSLETHLPPAGVTAVGALQGRLCRALADFSHPADSHFMPWDAMNGLVCSHDLVDNYLPDEIRRACLPHLERLERESLPRMHEFPSQVIHNDAHTGNIMCRPKDPSQITGIIDFGDLARRPLLTDLATSLSNFIGHTDDPMAVSGALVRGFREQTEFPEEQLALLYDASLARAILTVQLLTFRAVNTEGNEALRSYDLPNSIVCLENALDMDPLQFLDRIS